jgi:hypothetical protein
MQHQDMRKRKLHGSEDFDLLTSVRSRVKFLRIDLTSEARQHSQHHLYPSHGTPPDRALERPGTASQEIPPRSSSARCSTSEPDSRSPVRQTDREDRSTQQRASHLTQADQETPNPVNHSSGNADQQLVTAVAPAHLDPGRRAYPTAFWGDKGPRTASGQRVVAPRQVYGGEKNGGLQDVCDSDASTESEEPERQPSRPCAISRAPRKEGVSCPSR